MMSVQNSTASVDAVIQRVIRPLTHKNWVGMGNGCLGKITRIEAVTAPGEAVTDGAEFPVYTSLGIIGFVINEG